MHPINSPRTFDFSIFGAISHDHLLRGRTGALVDQLKKSGFFVYYFDIPPASIMQYIKNPLDYDQGLLNFLFPHPRILKNTVIFSQPPVLPVARLEIGWIRKYTRGRYYWNIRKNYLPFYKKRGKPVVALVETPWWYEIIKKMNFSLLCYDCIDDLRVFCKEKQLDYYTNLQRQLVNESDLILISAQKLRPDILELRHDAPIEYLPNGVDADFFITKGMNSTLPPKLKLLPKPIIGFVGSLFSWIDTKLLEITAKKFPHCSIVLVGPVQGIEIPNLPNIHLTGPEPYQSIPAYINNFDVCLIPFIAGAVSEKVDPIKVYEYLSLGKPVVAINLPELEKMKHLIYLAKNYEDFIQLIHQALNEADPKLKLKRVEYAGQNSWAVRINNLIDVISAELNKKI